MVLDFSPLRKWLAPVVAWLTAPVALPPDPVTWRAGLTLAQVLDPQTAVPAFVAACPTAARLRHLLAPLDWSAYPERPALRPTTATPYPGPSPEPRAPYLFFFLIGLSEGHRTHAKLARFLAEHPALLWLAGLRLTPDPTDPTGFDRARASPTRDRLRVVLRALEPTALETMLAASVHLFAAIPDFAHTVAGDSKHILAWVKQNNPKTAIAHRFDPTRQPRGDPDCKLGVKSSTNRTPTTDPLPATGTLGVNKHYFWGYASGVLATPLPDRHGEVILAEFTQTFDKSDLSYFHPLMARAESALGFKPPYGTWDAAFDAFYVYDYFHAAGGFAAVPLNLHGHPRPRLTPDGLPICERDLPMTPRFTYTDRQALVPQTKRRFACPLLFPTSTGATCSHPQFVRGGCTANRGISPGASVRLALDRTSDDYLTLYRQRSTVERVNARAVDLGVERPKLRNFASIRNHITLIYLLLNLQTFQRWRDRHPPPPE